MARRRHERRRIAPRRLVAGSGGRDEGAGPAPRPLRAGDGDEVTVVFDGRPFDIDATPAHVRFATRGGPNAADDDIAGMVAEHDDPGSLHVVPSDRDLIDRVTAAGAEVVPAGGF